MDRKILFLSIIFYIISPYTDGVNVASLVRSDGIVDFNYYVDYSYGIISLSVHQ